MSGGHFPAGFTRPTELPAYQAEPPVFRSIAVTSSSSSHDSHIDSSWNDTYHNIPSTSSSKELTSTTYVGTPQVKLPTRLKDLPSFYQPSTLICATSIHDAWHSLTSHFIKSHVNMTQDMSTAKIHGIYSIPHDATLLTFRVRLYNAAHLYPTSTTSIIAIEVTRRSGCIVAFQEFYRICTLVMGERLLTTPIPVAASAMPILRQVNNIISSSTSSSNSIPTMPTLPLPDHSEVELDSTTISTLTQQLRSLDLLTCRTGMASLVHLIKRHPSNQNLLIQYILSQHTKTPVTPVTSLTSTTPLLVIILYLLSSRMDIDLHRGCTTILSILCEHSSFMDLIIPCASMIQTLFMILDNHMNKISSTPNHFVSIFQRDIHRSIASIFAHFSQSQPDRLTNTLKTAASSQPQGISQYLYILDYYYNHSEPSVASQFDQMRKLCSY